MTPYEELCKAFKIKPAVDESYRDFAARAFKKINNASDTQWNALSEDLQLWNNYGQKALEALDPDDELPTSFELEDSKGVKTGEMTTEFGWPPSAEEAPVAEDEPDEDAEGADDSEPEADESTDDGVEPEEGEETTEEPVDAEDNSGQEEASEESTLEEPTESSTRSSKKAVKKPAPKAAKPKAPEPSNKTGKAKNMAKTPAAPPPKVAKKATSAASTRNARTSIGDNDVIKVLAKENPYRENSIGHKAFEKYKDGMKVKEFANKAKALGTERAPGAILRFDIKKGYIKVVAA